MHRQLQYILHFRHPERGENVHIRVSEDTRLSPCKGPAMLLCWRHWANIQQSFRVFKERHNF